MLDERTQTERREAIYLAARERLSQICKQMVCTYAYARNAYVHALRVRVHVHKKGFLN